VLLALEEVDSVLDEIRVEVLDLLLRELHFLQTADDLVVGQEALFLALGDELLELLDLGKRDLDREHVLEPPRTSRCTTALPQLDDRARLTPHPIRPYSRAGY
jgi:hypothetical protein